MIFYHFTCPWLFWGDDWKSKYDPETGGIDAPLRDLLPSNKQYTEEWLPVSWRVPVVWLTTRLETKPAETPNIMRLVLTVRLPSTDRRLRSYAKWLGHTGILPPDLDKKARAYWWTYRGVIPAKCIVASRLIMERRPWWEVIPPEVRAAA